MIHNFTRKQLIVSSNYLDSWKLFSAFFIGSEKQNKTNAISLIQFSYFK